MRRLAGLVSLLVLLTAASAGAAVTDTRGDAVANTDWSSPRAQLVGDPGCAGAAPGDACRPLAEPGSPGDDAPAALAALGRTGAPEDDLEDALIRMTDARDPGVAAAARAEALAILEGSPLPGRPYSGMPLLNWNAPAKVRTVPAGGTVEIREVRFPEHSVSDTWMLAFEDPDRPYTIRHRISELGGTAGGELKPAVLLADGDTRLGAVHSTLVALMPPSLATGTTDASRFTAGRGAGAVPEATRVAEQVVEVRMPPPRLTRAILQPDLRPDAASLLTLQPATPERLATAAEALGFSGGAPSDAERHAAIERLAATAPERQLWADLRNLPPADADGFLAAAGVLGTQGRALVDAMRTRSALPAGVAGDTEADLTLVFQNNETYVSRRRVRPMDAASLRVHVVNRDGFAHRVSAIALHDREAVLGAEDWGRFSWTPAQGGAVPAAESRTLTVPAPAGAFALWLGDAGTGDQAATIVDLDHGPARQSMSPTPDRTAEPLHEAMDRSGALWITLPGRDAVARVKPGGDLGASARSVHLIPGGRHTPAAPEPPLEPSGVAVDHRGVVWTTLTLGNAIARMDPAAARDGTTAGVTVHRLPVCRADECPDVFPPDPAALPTRMPLQIAVTRDAVGNTLVWFTQANVDRIGLLRVAPDGRELGQTHFSCGCRVPLGIALDAGGDVWFTEGVSNRLGRLTPDVSTPYAAAAATLRHYPIPSSVLVDEPELAREPVLTSNPHSVTVDGRGLVWFTESATSRIGVLDPERARPGTSEGIDEIALPHSDWGTPATPADLTVDGAGTVFWTDEYGDQVGTVRTSGPRAGWRPGRSLRPAARRSLTDSPLVDPAGNLYFLESAANRLTRIEGVSAGAPVVPRHARVEVDLAGDALAVRDLDDAASIDVTVRRDGATVAHVIGAGVRDGAVRIDGFDARDALRPGDVVRIAPAGPSLQAPFEAQLADLGARLAGGRVEGAARLGDRVPPGVVTADDGATAVIAPMDGRYAFAGTTATVRYTTTTPAATWVVRDGVAQPQPAPAEPQPDTPAGAPPGDPGTPPAGPPGPRDPVPPDATPPASGPACPTAWLTRGRPALLRLPTARLDACLGRPRAIRGTLRRYHDGLTLELRGGRVRAMRLTGPALTGSLGVGSRERAIRAALPGARAVSRTVRRAVVRSGSGRVADIRITVGGGRVRSIAARDLAERALDSQGRRLLRGAR